MARAPLRTKALGVARAGAIIICICTALICVGGAHSFTLSKSAPTKRYFQIRHLGFELMITLAMKRQ